MMCPHVPGVDTHDSPAAVSAVLLRALQNTMDNTPTLATSFKDFLSRLTLAHTHCTTTGGTLITGGSAGLSYNGMIAALPLPILLFRPRMIADMTQGLITHSDPNIHNTLTDAPRIHMYDSSTFYQQNF